MNDWNELSFIFALNEADVTGRKDMKSSVLRNSEKNERRHTAISIIGPESRACDA